MRANVGFARGAALAALSLVTACGGVAPQGSENQDEQPRLGITHQSALRVAGEHGEGVRFEAVTHEEGKRAATSVVRVGDAAFEWHVNPEEGEMRIDGHELEITAQQKAAFKALLEDLKARYVGPKGPNADYQGHHALLLGQLHWLSEAYAGMKVPRTTFYKRPDGKPGTAETQYNWGSDYNGPWWNWGPACAFRPPGWWNEAWICPWGWCGETEWAVVNGTGGAYWWCHGDGCLAKSGDHWGNWDCQGQCGAGCQDWWHAGVYQDCFEHDVCTDWHFDGDCNTDKIFAAPAFVDSYSGWCGGYNGGGR